MKRKPAEHGTVARYRHHLQDKDEPCQPCKTANAQKSYDRYYSTSPTEQTLRNRASARALTRIRRKYIVEYHLEYEKALQEVYKEAKENGER